MAKEKKGLGIGLDVLFGAESYEEDGSELLSLPISPANVSLVASATAAPNITRAAPFPEKNHRRAAMVVISPLART